MNCEICGKEKMMHGTSSIHYCEPPNLMRLRDEFAMSALTGLIAKSPFFDTEGENGQQKTSEDIDMFYKEIANSAYHYASAMLLAREQKN